MQNEVGRQDTEVRRFKHQRQ